MTVSSVGELLSDISSRGGSIKVARSGPVVEAPAGALDAGLKEQLRANRREIHEYLDRYGRMLEMPLSEFERTNSMLEVAVPGLTETLWFVPGSEHAEQLRLDGIRRGRVWTAVELRDLLTAPGMTDRVVLRIARAKLAFSGTIVEVVPAEQVAATPEPAAPAEGQVPSREAQASFDLGPAVPMEHDL